MEFGHRLFSRPAAEYQAIIMAWWDLPSHLTRKRLSIATHRTVTYARWRINQWLSDYLALQNSSTFRHLFLLDENAIAEQFGRRAVGCFIHTSAFQHATVFSQKLAAEYHSRISGVGKLLNKKLVICDLDNTLWDGVIGEGQVAHFEERQRILKKLKEHGGVVLSLASKNDPRSVHFSGGLLDQNDFVAPQISWNQKSESIARIKRTLNLQTKHMVFLDDRADERMLVQEAFPDILPLDPSDPEVWKRMNLWADLAFGSSDLDRTRLYQEQAQRDASAESIIEPGRSADVDALKKLGLVISIRGAATRDLKRVAELINRTNQWNLSGSRTAFEQVRGWHASNNSIVLVASAADRFGDMGIVCVSVVSVGGDRCEIPVFVLSCRVFGYGVETAMLNEICRRCDCGKQGRALVGHFRANNQNHSCRNMYSDHGFEPVDGSFVWKGSPELYPPQWAEVRTE
jgi:FkbH-like protein